MILKGIYTFVVFLQMIIVLYIMMSWIFRFSKLTNSLKDFLSPVLEPLKWAISKSAINTRMIDFSPIIALLILSYIEKVLYYMVQ